MNRIVLTTGLLAAAALAADHFVGLQARIDELERRPRADPELVRALARELNVLRGSLVEVRDASDTGDAFERIDDKLAVVASIVARENCRLEDQAARLDGWETRWSAHGPEVFDARVSELTQDLDSKRCELEELREHALQASADGEARFAELSTKVEPLLGERDTQRLWRELVGPVVQLSGDTTVGSGVLLESQRRDGAETWTTYLITSWHVVRDIYGSLDRTAMPVPVRMYAQDGTTRDEHASMVAFDVPLDIALLKLDLDEAVPYGARLAPPQDLERAAIFDAIYAVGCPLGNDPIPTLGEIAATHHVVDGSLYWMISAPTYIGNSGGGVFDARTHELIGIFSKIYTHGASRSTIVPHMGLATPMTVIYDWMEHAGCAALIAPAQAQPRAASATR